MPEIISGILSVARDGTGTLKDPETLFRKTGRPPSGEES